MVKLAAVAVSQPAFAKKKTSRGVETRAKINKATLAIIKRETNSWFWPFFVFTYMTLLAYGAAWVTFQAGVWIST